MPADDPSRFGERSSEPPPSRQDRRRELLAGATVAVGLAVVALGAGARGSKGVGPRFDTDLGGGALALAALGLLAGAVAVMRGRRLRRRHAGAAAAVLAVLAVFAGAGWLVTHLFHGSSTSPRPREVGSTGASLAPSASPPPAHHASSLGAMPVVGGSLIGVLVVVAVVAALLAWRRKKAEPDVAGDPRGAVYAAVDAGVEAMRDVRDPRAAIIACYAAMERTLAKAGVRRRAAETPNELLAHAVALGHAPDAAARLTELFLEARYSTHPMSESDRDAARAALARLREPDVFAANTAEVAR